MSEQQMLMFTSAVVPDARAGGLAVSVDRSFASARRVQLDETSWVDHVTGWLAGDDALMDLLRELAPWEQRSRWMYTRQVVEPRLTAEYPVISAAGAAALARSE